MIHIYYMNLSGDCSYEQSLALYRLLPKERKQKVKSSKQENVARKRLYTGAFLQYVLSEETGIPMEDISYIYGSQGKPELACNPVCFNLSHSGEYAVLAVSDQSIGIDIEYKKRNYQSVAKRCFCKEEYEDIIEATSVEEQEKRFLQYWTMKEAFIKRSGEGLSVPLNSFRIIRQDSGISFVEGGQAWFAGCFWKEEPYCISLCSESEQDVKALVGKDGKVDLGVKEILVDQLVTF